MLKYFPRQFFLSCLFSLSLLVSAPVQAQNWGEWAQSFKDWWSQEAEEEQQDDDNYAGVYILMAFLVANGLLVDGGCE